MKASILPFNYQSSEYFDELIITFYGITFTKSFGKFRKNNFFKIAELNLRDGILSAWNGEDIIDPAFQTKFNINELT